MSKPHALSSIFKQIRFPLVFGMRTIMSSTETCALDIEQAMNSGLLRFCHY